MYNKSRFISLFLLAGMAITCCLAGCKKKDMSLKLNEPHNIRGVISYKRSFGDLNEKHLNVAQAIGIRPLASREEAEKMKEKLQYIATNDLYAVDSLTHSVPYLIPGAAALLDTIGYNFLDSLAAKGLNLRSKTPGHTISAIMRIIRTIVYTCFRFLHVVPSSFQIYGTASIRTISIP